MPRLIDITLGLSLLLSHPLYAATIAEDEAALRKLNTEIAAAEDRGDSGWLASILASKLSFRRANGLIVDREQFLSEVKARAPGKIDIESITIHGRNRAVVTCIVTLKVDGQDTAFHNVRLFIREASGWKLLGWANERLATQ